MKALAEFIEAIEEPYGRLGRWKAENDRKIVGCLPLFIPEELIHAAGMLPIVILENTEPITHGQSLIQSFFCGFARSNIDIALKGRLDFLDGIVAPDTCHTVRGVAGILKRNLPHLYHDFLSLPAALDLAISRPYLLGELRRFKASLEQFAGGNITDKALGKSIGVYNRNRSLLKELYELRRTRPGLLGAKEIAAVVVSGMLMPKEEHNGLLEALLLELRAELPAPDEKVRLVLSGSLCEAPPDGLLELIEDVGAVIADDDLYTGKRYFLTQAEVGTDPVEALADRYLNMAAPCPTRHNPEHDWADFLLGMVKGSGAEGVITILVKFCEPHAFYYPYVRQRLLAASVPELMIETEHEALALGQIRTRLEAFIETIRGEREHGD